MKSDSLLRISLAGLTGVTGEAHHHHLTPACSTAPHESAGTWFPRPSLRVPDAGQGFKDEASCLAAVKFWKNSLTNVGNNRAD